MEKDNYYAALSYIKLDDTVPAGSKTQKSLDTDRYLKRDVLNKGNMLIAVGLTDEAAMELKSTGWSVTSFDDIISVSLKLADMGRYRDAISISTRLPKSKRPDEVLYPRAFWKTISGVASEYNIDPLLVLSIIREESRFDTSAYSPAGAMGLMQLMPKTAEDLSQRLGMRRAGGNALYEVETNVRLGSFYLSRLIREFGSVHPAIAAYNAGESNVRRWLNSRAYTSYDEFIEDIPYPETRKYLMRIINSYAYYKRNGAGGM